MPQQQKTKKPPLRHCVGCGEGKAKKELVRVVRSKEGQVSLDDTGKAPGRGAYLCRSAACLAKARKKKALERAFGLAVPGEVYERLEQQLATSDADG